MKYLICLFALLCFCISANAQQYQYVPMIDKPAMWQMIRKTESKNADSITKKCYQYNYQFSITGADSVIAGVTWKKVLVRQTRVMRTLFNPSPCELPTTPPKVADHEDYMEFFREDNKVVTQRSGPGDLYNFNKTVGENIGFKQTITGIDTILFGGVLRKRFFIASPEFGPDTIIEGIGSLRCGPEAVLLSEHCHITCHEYESNIIYNNPEHPCGAIFPNTTPTNIANTTQSGEIHVYPNPFTNYIQLSDVPHDAVAHIYNNLGQLALQTTVGNGKIETSALPAGVYSLRLVTPEGVVFNTRRLVKQ